MRSKGEAVSAPPRSPRSCGPPSAVCRRAHPHWSVPCACDQPVPQRRGCPHSPGHLSPSTPHCRCPSLLLPAVAPPLCRCCRDPVEQTPLGALSGGAVCDARAGSLFLLSRERGRPLARAILAVTPRVDSARHGDSAPSRGRSHHPLSAACPSVHPSRPCTRAPVPPLFHPLRRRREATRVSVLCARPVSSLPLRPLSGSLCRAGA